MSTRKATPRPRKLPKNVTAKQQTFVREYLTDYNGTKAAMRAGYSQRTARVQASALLTKLNIQTELARLARPIAKKAELKASTLLAMLMRQADADPRDFVTNIGRMKKLHELEEDVAKLIAGFKIEGTELKEVKLKDGMKATELLMKNQGMLREQVAVELSGQVSVLEQQRVKEFSTEELAEFNAAAATCQRLLHPETL